MEKISSGLPYDIIKKLSFIRYIYSQGLNYYSIQPEPISSISVLLFHDSIEFYLQMVCDYKDVNDKNADFMAYFTLIQEKCGIILQEKENMRKLNYIRNNLKHKGLIPSQSEINTLNSNVKNFFISNTLTIFNTDFNSFSLIDFIDFDVSKDLLKRANEYLEKNDFDNAAKDISMSFEKLLRDYLRQKVGINYFIEEETLIGSTHKPVFSHRLDIRNTPGDLYQKIQDLDNYCKYLEQQDKIIKETIKIITLGIDYKKYLKFRKFIPRVLWYLGGGNSFINLNSENSVYNKEDLEFCIDFVIESAIKIQELSINKYQE